VSEPTEGPMVLRWSTGPILPEIQLHEREYPTLRDAVDAAFGMYTNHTGTPATISKASGFYIYGSQQLREAWLAYYARGAAG
jgi:hypothetical protein